MTRMFTFDPAAYAPVLARQDFVHIPQGLSEEFYDIMCRQVDDYYQANRLKQHARGDKQQALYEFPSTAHYEEFLTTLGELGGLPAEKLVISERHIKGYEAGAAPRPMPHKDRHSTQLAVGFTVRAPEGSTLVLYPQGERSINLFGSWAELKSSLTEEHLPPGVLRNVPRVEIRDRPRDVVVFLGNQIWHARENGASTVMLYFKINASHSDPLGEDPRTPLVVQKTREMVELGDEELKGQVAILGRRVDYLQRRYSRDWQELHGVVLYGESHFTVDDDEWLLLQALDGRRPLRDVLQQLAGPSRHERLLNGVRRLAKRGVIDLLPGHANRETQGAQDWNARRSRDNASRLDAPERVVR
ncbi:MAG: hypothetical protein FJ271_22920 [Planctomycetes bacterium]|nr:hypothetical protein [Planctomycetota bacterium]